MNLLIFFALPLATILLAIVLQNILKCPILVTITFLAIYLITIFGLYGTGVIENIAAGLVAIIVYTLIAFITAYIVKFIANIRKRFFSSNGNILEIKNSNNTNDNSTTDSMESNQSSLERTGCFRGCYRRM